MVSFILGHLVPERNQSHASPCTIATVGNNGFVVPPIDYENIHVNDQDEYDLKHLYQILEDQILPLYYDNKDTWRDIVKNGMNDVQVQFESNRMADEYYQILYK